MLHGLEKNHHYCFARDISIITNYKSLVAIFKKDIATLSQQIQCILLWIHQYWVRIIYKPRIELFTVHWLSMHNHIENKDEEMCGTYVKVDAIQMTTDIQEWIIAGWQEIKDQVQHDIWSYWSFGNDMEVISGIIMKGRHVIIPDALKAQELDQLHINHMGIEKTKLQACESIYWININDDIKNFIKIALHVLHFSRHNLRTRWGIMTSMRSNLCRHVHSQ